MHKHKFIKALKEGIKASDILIKKKIKVIKYIIIVMLNMLYLLDGNLAYYLVDMEIIIV